MDAVPRAKASRHRLQWKLNTINNLEATSQMLRALPLPPSFSSLSFVFCLFFPSCPFCLSSPSSLAFRAAPELQKTMIEKPKGHWQNQNFWHVQLYRNQWQDSICPSWESLASVWCGCCIAASGSSGACWTESGSGGCCSSGNKGAGLGDVPKRSAIECSCQWPKQKAPIIISLQCWIQPSESWSQLGTSELGKHVQIKHNTSPEWARSKALPPQSPWPSFPFFPSFLSCLSSLFYPSFPFFPWELNKDSQGNWLGKDTRADTYKAWGSNRKLMEPLNYPQQKSFLAGSGGGSSPKRAPGSPWHMQRGSKRQMQQAGLMHKGFQNIKGTNHCGKANIMMPHIANCVRFNIEILASSISSSLSCSNGSQINWMIRVCAVIRRPIMNVTLCPLWFPSRLQFQFRTAPRQVLFSACS